MTLIRNIITKQSDFTQLVRLAGVNQEGTPIDVYIQLDEFYNELSIYEPATEPIIVTGTPNTLTLDCNSAKQARFEPRLSSGVHAINVDFDLIHTNKSNAFLISDTLRLTGTRIIKMESDVQCSVPSSIGTWVAPNLTLACGTDDDIILVFQKNKTTGKFVLSVDEVAT